MESGNAAVRVSADIALAPAEAFDALVEELANALALRGMSLEVGQNGRVTEGAHEVGRVIAWEPGKLIRFQWRQADWEPAEVTEIEMRLEPIGDGVRVTVEHRGWGGLLGDAREFVGWFAGEIATPFLIATSPAGLGDWLTDRRARRPSGARSRDIYRDPLYHYPNFRVILAELALIPDDYLIEVGCGGGAFLREALKSRCHAAAIDHSPDMVRLARKVNHDAVTQGLLDVRLASADHLPFPDGTFTCAAMTGVLGFLPDPVAAFREIWRVLGAGGRFVALGSDPALRGTPAAPEPMASRLHFYEDDELRELALAAGFEQATAVRRTLEPFARQVGIPEEHLTLFAGDTSFLLAQKNVSHW
ncbi:MAG TPA: methyltransferase domain-containing protein [Ktedonobacterales bacterium]|nr:methyltransferase domain-containing protein [Ktedonobacterales bacterium]